MAVNMPTAIGAAGTTAFGAQSLVPLIDWLARHYQVQPELTPDAQYSLALILIGAGGAIIGTTVVIARALMLRWLKKHHVEIPPETEKPNA